MSRCHARHRCRCVGYKASGRNAAREFPSGPTLTAEQMVAGVKKLTEDWTYDAVTIGYPGPVINNRPLTDPWNLGGGWMGYDFAAAFKIGRASCRDREEIRGADGGI